MPLLRRLVLNRLAVVGVLIAVSAPALAFLTPTWNNATTDTGSTTDFDTGTLLFPAQLAAQITIVAPGAGYYHDHGNGGGARFEVLRNGVWTPVFTAPVSNNIDIPLSSLPVPLASFSSGQISGVRLSCTVVVGQCYHSIEDPMQFSLTGGTIESIPTMSTYALIALALGLLLAGMSVVRTRQSGD